MANVKQKMVASFKSYDLGEALRLADSILAVDPDDLEALSVKANILALPDPEFCNYEAAVRISEDAVARHPSDMRYLLALADVQKNTGEYAAAEQSYRRVMQVDVDNLDARLCLASLEGHPGTNITSAEAQSLLEAAIQHHPAQWKPHAVLAQNLYRHGKYRDAARQYELALLNTDSMPQEFRNSLNQELIDVQQRLKM